MTEYLLTPNRLGHHPFPLLAASDDLIFVTGLAALGETAAEQARTALTEISTLLEDAGSSLAEIVFFRPLVASREDVPEVDGVLREMLPTPRPASGALLICDLVTPELKVVFEAIAHRGARLVLPAEASGPAAG